MWPCRQRDHQEAGDKGKEIHPGFGNANKLMNRLLMCGEAYSLRIDTLDGGNLRNASRRPRSPVRGRLLVPSSCA
jgi:dipeptidase D